MKTDLSRTSGAHLLVVEDDADDYSLLLESLREIHGPEYTPCWARSVEEALHLWQAHRPDLVLTDYHLGASNGLDLLRRLKAADPSMPVILMMGVYDERIDHEAAEAGAADYLEKGNLSARGLDRSMRFALQSSRQERTLRRMTEQLEQTNVAFRTAFFRLQLRPFRVTSTGSGLRRLLGLDVESLQSPLLSCLRLFAPRQRRRLYMAFRQLRAHSPVDLICERARPEGVRYLRVEAHLDEDSRELHGRVTDITERRRQEKLLGNQARLLDMARDGICVCQEASGVSFWNRGCEQLFGWRREETEGKCLSELIGTEREVIAMAREAVLRTGEWSGELDCHARDGSEIIVSCRMNRADESGAILAILSDNTAASRAHEMLRESESFLRESNAIARVGGWSYDCTTATLKWSEMVRRIHEVPETYEPTVGPAIEFFEGTARERIREAFEKCLARGRPYCLELPLRTARGRRLWVLTKGQAEREGGQAVRVRGILQDISAFKSIQRENEAFFDLSIEMITVASPDGYFRRLSPAWTRTLGWSETELRSRPFIEFVHPEDVEKTREAIRQLVQSNLLFGLENRYRHRDGTWRNLVWNAYYSPEEGLFYAMARDTTEQHKQEQTLREALARAEEANRTKTEFLAMMSHELRTPLNAIIGFAQLLGEDLTSPDQLQMLGVVENAGNHLLELIDDILEFSSLETRRFRLKPSLFRLDGLLQSLHDTFLQRFLDAGLDLHFERKAGEALFRRELEADARRLRQVLSNFLSNARKFTPSGSVTLTVRLTGKSAAGPRWRFEVRDEGTGIAPEVQEEIFKPFFQIDSSISRQHEGAGLGLAICARIATEMGGEVGVQSEPGKGSLFWLEVVLPFAHEAVSPSAPHHIAEQGLPQAPVTHANVLLVEDEIQNATYASLCLQRMGCQVTLARDGREAVRCALQKPFDLILMDLRMPVLDGIEATRQILESLGSHRTPPIIAVTAQAASSDREKCTEAGMRDFLSKPYRRQDLAEMVTKWVPAAAFGNRP